MILGWIFLLVFISSTFHNPNYQILIFSFSFFIIDYIVYRFGEKARFSFQSRKLEELMKSGSISEYDLNKEKTSNPVSVETNTDYQRHITSLKGEKIEFILNEYSVRSADVLSVGCGGELHQAGAKPYFDRGFKLTGVDINEQYAKEFSEVFDADVVMANAMALPFTESSFDLINLTDILEHLHNPVRGLEECFRCLKPDGLLILTTNNFTGLDSHVLNPLVFTERVAGLYIDLLLPPRSILGSWGSNVFFHTEFTYNELRSHLFETGFEIKFIEAYFTRRRKYLKHLEKIPLLRFLGNEFFVVAKKNIV